MVAWQGVVHASVMHHISHGSGACFSKVPKLFGPISGATIAFISSQLRGSKPSNFAVLLVFLILKTCEKISCSKQADCSLITSFSGPKSSRDFRETGPWCIVSPPYFWPFIGSTFWWHLKGITVRQQDAKNGCNSTIILASLNNLRNVKNRQNES